MDPSAIYPSLTKAFVRAEGATGSIASGVVAKFALAISSGLAPRDALVAAAYTENWLNDGSAITALYQSVVGRDPDTHGFRAWLDLGNAWDIEHGDTSPGLSTGAVRAIGAAMLAAPEAVQHGATAASVDMAVASRGAYVDKGFFFAIANALDVSFAKMPPDLSNHVAVTGAILPSEWL